MGDILNFNPNRNLQFDPNRELEFAPGRALEFNPGRGLEFNANRDLGFGHRGVVFRGYVCPICGALVAEDAVKCDECGTVFEGKPRASQPPTPAPAPLPTPSGPAPQIPSTRSGVLCSYCGSKLHARDAFCWKCGTRTTESGEVAKLPPQKSEPVTREWR